MAHTEFRSKLISLLWPLASGLAANFVRARSKRRFLAPLAYQFKVAARSSRIRSFPDVAGTGDARITTDLGDGAWVVLIAKAIGARRVFEFGTFLGATAMSLAENLPECDIVTLDLPLGVDFERLRADSPIEIEQGDRHWTENPRRESLICGEPAKRITALHMDSAQLDETHYLGQFDLIYIDGSHTYTGVRSDSEKAFRMLAPGGVIVWDDLEYPGIWRYLNELSAARHDLAFIEPKKVVLLNDTLKANRKVPVE